MTGVSTATVSRALNQPNLVQPETRERILEAMHTTGYFSSIRRYEKKHMLLFLYNEDDYTFYEHINNGFNSVLQAKHYVIVQCSISADEVRRKEQLAFLSAQKFAGVIWALRDFFPSEAELFNNNNIPIVLARKYSRAPEKYHRCYADFAVGSFRMTQHLFSLDCRKIFLMVEKASFQFVESFCSGWKRAYFENDLMFSEDWIIHTPNTVQGGYTKALELLSASNAPDAFFCASNEMAFGVLRAARDLGISVPEKLAVVGFTDSPTATCTEPELTTLCQPIEQLGAILARMLLDILETPQMAVLQPQEIVLQPQICIRKSC